MNSSFHHAIWGEGGLWSGLWILISFHTDLFLCQATTCVAGLTCWLEIRNVLFSNGQKQRGNLSFREPLSCLRPPPLLLHYMNSRHKNLPCLWVHTSCGISPRVLVWHRTHRAPVFSPGLITVTWSESASEDELKVTLSLGLSRLLATKAKKNLLSGNVF